MEREFYKLHSYYERKQNKDLLDEAQELFEEINSIEAQNWLHLHGFVPLKISKEERGKYYFHYEFIVGDRRFKLENYPRFFVLRLEVANSYNICIEDGKAFKIKYSFHDNEEEIPLEMALKEFYGS